MTHKKSYVNWDTVPVIMDLPIAAHLLGLSADYLRKLAKAGSFPPAFKPSPRAWRVEKCVKGMDRVARPENLINANRIIKACAEKQKAAFGGGKEI